MAQKREAIFDSLYGGGALETDEDEMLEGNKDMLTKNDQDASAANMKLKEGMELKAERELEINGKDYHISF